MRELCGIVFKSMKECKEWIKGQLDRMYTKGLSYQDKEMLYEIIKGHPDPKKIEGVKDFRILQMSNSKQLQILKDEWEPISWICCSTGKGRDSKYLLNRLLRTSIMSQIQEFRKSVKNQICELCNSIENLQVDHINLFSDLVKEFNSTRNIPTEFIGCGEILSFIDKDISYKNEWIEFHKKNATFRILCQNCNLKTYRDRNIK